MSRPRGHINTRGKAANVHVCPSHNTTELWLTLDRCIEIIDGVVEIQ